MTKPVSMYLIKGNETYSIYFMMIRFHIIQEESIAL